MVASNKGYRCHSADDVTNLGEALLEYDTAVASILILSLSPPPYGNVEGIRLTPVGTSFNGGKLQRIPLPFLGVVTSLGSRAARFWRRGCFYPQSFLMFDTLWSFIRSPINPGLYWLQW
jgi:hypothetical protein